METIIREYQETDNLQIIAWMEKLHDYLVEIDPDKRLRRQPEYGQMFFDDLKKFIENGQGKIYVAVDGEKPVGFSAGAVDIQSKKTLAEVVPSKLGVISYVFVEETNRSAGVGQMLIKKLEDYLQSLGCDSLWINVLAFNPAHDLYKRLNYRDREIGMFKKL